MSRSRAKKTFTTGQLRDSMGDRTWLSRHAGALLDEAPGSYKDIDQVMADQEDLVTVDVRLDQIVNYKGT